MLPKDEYKKLRDKCKHKFAYARKKGQIEPIGEHTKCVDCGEPAEMYDHRNYYKPLEVEPVCRKCNGQRGQAYPGCEEWYKKRAGLEATLPDEKVDFDVPLTIDYDFQGHDDHMEYLQYFDGVDPEVHAMHHEILMLAYYGTPIKQYEGTESFMCDGIQYTLERKYNKRLKRVTREVVDASTHIPSLREKAKQASRALKGAL